MGLAVDVTASSIPWVWGYWSYSNPYCGEPIPVGDVYIDYSRPIVTTPEASATADQPSPAADQTSASADAAREAFRAGDYPTALAQIDKAIAQSRNELAFHEFRSLVLFATQRYKEAAGGIYAVLAMGPGWDWTTMISLYPNVETYTTQLRALEAYRKANPDVPEAHFLLAYHYLTCGYADVAAKELQAVTRLNPGDKLAAQLLAAVATPEGTAPSKPAATAPPSQPLDAASLAGSWEASQPDGSITLALTADGKYNWKYSHQGKAQEFRGDYTLAANVLILKQGAAPAMVGQVALLAADRLSFKLANGNPSDPGLTFSKRP
jgi:tetratricopeptide (TPR) repeat protein